MHRSIINFFHVRMYTNYSVKRSDNQRRWHWLGSFCSEMCPGAPTPKILNSVKDSMHSCGWSTQVYRYSNEFNEKQLWAVADPGFPRGGGANSQGGAPTYDFVNFRRKLHENEEILAARGGRASPAPPLRSATGECSTRVYPYPKLLNSLKDLLFTSRIHSSLCGGHTAQLLVDYQCFPIP